MAYCVPRGIPHSRFLRWSSDDQDKALAWSRDQAATCSGCGTRLDEWADDRLAYIGDLTRCPGCETLEQERQNIPPDAKGVYARLLPKRAALERNAAGVDGLP